MSRRRNDGAPAKAPDKRLLTDLAVRKAQPKDGRPYLIHDTKQRGLAVRVEPSGFKSWKCIYSFNGRPRWVSLGAADAITLADARLLASRVMFSVAEGRDPAAEKKAARSQGTFQELAARYVNEYAQRHNKSWKQGKALVDRYLLPRWGKLPAADITRSDVKSAMAAITAKMLANQVLANASAVFSWAVKEELLKSNPCQKIDRHPAVSRQRVLADSELPIFWAAFDGAGLLQGTALRIVLLSGQRPGEVAAMRWEHIIDGWWTLPGAPEANGWKGTKNGATHRVWLSVPVQTLLRELWTDDKQPTHGAVFPRLGHIDAAMRTICGRLRTTDNNVTPHDLRRSFSTKVAALGFGREALNRVTNHKEGGIASVYDRHQYGDENKRIMETVAAHIISVATGTTTDTNVLPLRRGA